VKIAMPNAPEPLATLFDQAEGQALPLPLELADLYGRLTFPTPARTPYLIANFVSTLDGVVSLNLPGQAGGGPISGKSQHDHLVMGLLRAVADAVIVGAGTQRAVAPTHRWTASYIYPALADTYRRLRRDLAKEEQPLNVIVTARGEVNLALPLFQAGDVPVCLVTTPQGEVRLRKSPIPPAVQIVVLPAATELSAHAIIEAVSRVRACRLILVEGGPRLLGRFLAEQQLDKLFLTLAPQIAGRDEQTERPGLVGGQLFAPAHPCWGQLISVKRGGSHLFLRYTFQTQQAREGAS
jgi:riboflavin biosynthesis pyrimidine reductase